MSGETLERLVDTYLFYSYPTSVFAFQGGEPTLAGLPFFEKLIELQQRHGRGNQAVSNAMQTNAVLIDKNWCDLFREYQWLLGVSLDGPEGRKVRVRHLDKTAEGVAGQKPGTCTMNETCDSYVVVEYNGDVYPCDFFVEGAWDLGNVKDDSWTEIARRGGRYCFGAKKT